MTYSISYKIQGIDGQFKIPIKQEDDVNTITSLIQEDYSIIPELSAKIYGSYLQSTAIFYRSVQNNDVVTFLPKNAQQQITMSKQVIISPRNQSHTNFIVYSTINFETMTTGDQIEIDFDNSTEIEIQTKIIGMLNEKYSDKTGREIKKVLLFLPGGIPFYKNTETRKFIESFPNFLPHLYSIVLYDDRITDSILDDKIENICDIRGEPRKTLFSPYFDSETNGLCEIASILAYIAKNGPNSKSLIYSIAKFCPFAPLINGLFGLTYNITGLDVLQITAPLSVLFVEMSQNLTNKTNLFSSSSKFLSFFMNIKISNRVPCTSFNRPFYKIGYEKFFHNTIEETTEIGCVIAFNPDFEDQDWIRFQLPSLTEDDFELSMSSSNELSISIAQLFKAEKHVSLIPGKNGPCLFLGRESDNMVEYINPEEGIIETENKEQLLMQLIPPSKPNIVIKNIDLVDPKKVTQLIFFCISKSESMKTILSDGISRFDSSQKLAILFAENCYHFHLTSLYGLIVYNEQIEVRSQLDPILKDFTNRVVKQNEELSGESASFKAIQAAANNLMEEENRRFEKAVLRIAIFCDGEDKTTNKVEKAAITNFLIQNQIKVDSFFFSQDDIAKDIVALSHFTGGVSILLNNYIYASDFFRREEFYNVEMRKFREVNQQNLAANVYNNLPEISINELDKSIEIKEDKFTDPNMVVIDPSAQLIESINHMNIPMMSKRIVRELILLITEPLPNVKVFPLKDHLNCWRILIKGSDDSLYANKWFYMIVKFPNEYPVHYPLFRFVYPPFHPSISESGRVFINTLDFYYKSSMTIKEIIQMIIDLLIHPDFNYILDRKTEGMKIDDARFLQLVTEWNQRNGRDSINEWISSWKIENNFEEVHEQMKVFTKPIYLMQQPNKKK